MTTTPPPPNRSAIRGVIVAGLIAVTAGSLLALNFAAPTNTARWERTFPATDRLSIVGDSTVRVETWDREDISVALDAKWYGRRSTPKATVKGDTLEARACDGSFWHSFYWHAHCSADFVIRVPEGMTLTAHGNNGHATIRGRFADLDVSTDRGQIDAEDVISPRVNLHTDSGAIAFTGTAPIAEIDTDRGSIRVDAASTDLNASADSGSITLNLREIPDRVAANTDSGSVSVTVPLSEYRVSASTDSGRQNIDPRLTSGSSSRTIDLSTDSGSITLQGLETP